MLTTTTQEVKVMLIQQMFYLKFMLIIILAFEKY